MTAEQIIKALECCFSNGSCDGCPYTERVDCRRELERNALALIKELQGQIVGLNSALDALRDVAKDYENHNENLKRENKYLRESLADEREHKEDMEGIKNECGTDN
jgi:chromosome segregation ATPase